MIGDVFIDWKIENGYILQDTNVFQILLMESISNVQIIEEKCVYGDFSIWPSKIGFGTQPCPLN